MKILYAIQATGNGHISRAMELLPYLNKYGQTDLFLSGSNSTLTLDASIKFRSKGLSLFYKCNGSLDYLKMTSHFAPARIMKEARDLPVEDYDIILNDFESITSLACRLKKVPSLHFGHQASFISEKTPRPAKRNLIGEMILRNYAPATKYIGLHFDNYDTDICSPVIKRDILEPEPRDKGHVTIYLPSYCEKQLDECFKHYRDLEFEIFSHQCKFRRRSGNIQWFPVDRRSFNESMINCHGLICGGGFETPAEALILGKKMISIPIKGQYEQQCNAAALGLKGVRICTDLGQYFHETLKNWLGENQPAKAAYRDDTQRIIDKVIQCGREIKNHR